MPRSASAPPTLPERRAGRVRPTLPGWRPLAGGLLVTLAMLGAWAAGSPRTEDRDRAYLVARRDLDPGHALTPADVRVVHAPLAASVAGRVLVPGSTTTGAILLGPVRAGDLIASSLVLPPRQVPRAHEVSFVVEQPWAVDGSLVVGEHIDVLVTYGEGLGSQTRRVLQGARVVGLSDRDGSGLTASAGQTITVAITEERSVLAAVNAARAGTLTVVRATGAPRTASADSYHPAVPSTTTTTTAPRKRSGGGS